MVSAVSAEVRLLVLELNEIGAFKFGSFTLKSGIQSPFYVDLRLTVSHPAILGRVASALNGAIADVPHKILCGVPYTALPFATVMSMQSGVPMVMRRKEAKSYGTKRLIEGVWADKDQCLIVEDLCTSGLSVMETVRPIVESGMTCTDVVVLLDREQGARANLMANNMKLHAVVTISSMLDVLESERRIDRETAENVREFIRENQVPSSAEAAPMSATDSASAPCVTYEKRVDIAANPVAKALLRLMADKKTNLAVAADVTTTAELLGLADSVGPEICILKTHADIVSDWDASTATRLRALADKHRFLIFEDRKFADIGNTVVQQCNGGVHRISEWADVINAHPVPGPGVVSGLAKAANASGRNLGLLLLAEMSSAGNLACGVDGYTRKTIAMAQEAMKDGGEFVCGFISMGKIAGDEFVYMTPGVKLEKGGDALGQRYNTPASVIGERQSDVIIAGRGIYMADDTARAASEYRVAGWNAYLTRCSANQ
jgi:uridine monophosphate synthetase